MVWVAGEGLVTDEDLIRLAHQVSSDPLFGPQMRLLCDWSEVTQSKVTQVGIAYEVANSRFSVTSRRAYVVRGGPETQVVAYLTAYSSPAEALNIRTFNRKADAVAWLNEGIGESQRLP